MIDLEIFDLRLVKVIQETGSLTGAARKLHTTQSALSKRLMDLERRVGAKLFQRKAKGMAPTDIGTEVISIAEDILGRLLLAEIGISRRARGAAGELKLGVHCVSCYSWLPEALARFQAEFPEVKLTVANAEDYVNDLEYNRVDVVITHLHPEDIKHGVAYEDLFTADLVAIMAVNHPLAGKRPLDLDDFASYDYYSLLEKSAAPLYSYFLKPAGIEPRSFVVLNQAQALMAMVAAHQGLGVLPAFVVRDMVASGKLVQTTIKGVPLRASLVVAHRDDQSLSNYAKEFIRISREMASAGV